ncbi:hypothetical protein [Natranaerobius trueperi]|uniref:Uncharacterized protein n=1 Tax=Natranaerobius trueperi TaxID=759412 RepID=A0A226BWJ8_9FIRM|nr:hypothetical protein [Natranaerobius trueperi]OWZ83376.1 hypothetical protein CDO51_08725 [Natranaerobius trueperi]
MKRLSIVLALSMVFVLMMSGGAMANNDDPISNILESEIEVTEVDEDIDVNIERLVVHTSLYEGYSFEFTLDNATICEVDDVKINLYRDDSKLATNELDSWEELDDESGLSSPFAPFGSFDYEEDGYWENTWHDSRFLVPDEGEVIVTINDEDYEETIDVDLDSDAEAFLPDEDDIELERLSGVSDGYSYEVVFNGFDSSHLDELDLNIYGENEKLATNTATDDFFALEENDWSSPIRFPTTYEYDDDNYWNNEWHESTLILAEDAELIIDGGEIEVKWEDVLENEDRISFPEEPVQLSWTLDDSVNVDKGDELTFDVEAEVAENVNWVDDVRYVIEVEKDDIEENDFDIIKIDEVEDLEGIMETFDYEDGKATGNWGPDGFTLEETKKTEFKVEFNEKGTYDLTVYAIQVE